MGGAGQKKKKKKEKKKVKAKGLADLESPKLCSPFSSISLWKVPQDKTEMKTTPLQGFHILGSLLRRLQLLRCLAKLNYLILY